MDYRDELDEEADGAHSAFHEFVLLLAEDNGTAQYSFFEGDEDPAFYNPYIMSRLRGRAYHQFVCNGRTEVLKAHELISDDGRAIGRSTFFIDKDHTNIMTPNLGLPPANVFVTEPYSIENYFVSEAVFRRYWTERLHLKPSDTRLAGYLVRLHNLLNAFQKRCRILMSITLHGRGIENSIPSKLNLNNVQLEKVIKIDYQKGLCFFKKGAGRHYLASSNCSAPSLHAIRTIYRTHLQNRSAHDFIRGKYHLWFFWKIISVFTKELSDHNAAKNSNSARATPKGTLPFEACVEGLCSLLLCPPGLSDFLDQRITQSVTSH